MFSTFEGETADEVWLKIADAFRSGVGAPQESRAGDTSEILHAAISISDPRRRWVLSRTPPINPAFALAEVVWIMAGRNDSGFLNYFNSQLPQYAGKGDTYHGAYGYRLRHRLRFDQLRRAFEVLLAQPESRQVVLQIWDGSIDFPHENGSAAAPDVPCNISSLLKIRDGRLEWTQIIRSNDVFRGLPYNLVQFTALQEILAGWLGVEIGSYNQVSDSLHVYSDCLDAVRQSRPQQFQYEPVAIGVGKRESEAGFSELARVTDGIAVSKYTAKELEAIVGASQLGPGLRNVLSIITAEACRRMHRPDEMMRLANTCSDQGMRTLFERWRDSRPSAVEAAR